MKIKQYGEMSFRGTCALEDSEQIMFLKWLERNYKHLWELCIHPKNEGKRTMAQAKREKEMGLKKGAPDLIIMTTPPILIEMKRRDPTKNKATKEQIDFLEKAQAQGARCAICYGSIGAKEFIDEIS
jgi:hypothetical protein